MNASAFAKDRDAEWEAALGELSSSLACGSPENKTPDQWSKIISDGIDMLTRPLVEQLAAERAAKETAERRLEESYSCGAELRRTYHAVIRERDEVIRLNTEATDQLAKTICERTKAIRERDEARAEVERLSLLNMGGHPWKANCKCFGTYLNAPNGICPKCGTEADHCRRESVLRENERLTKQLAMVVNEFESIYERGKR